MATIRMSADAPVSRRRLEGMRVSAVVIAVPACMRERRLSNPTGAAGPELEPENTLDSPGSPGSLGRPMVRALISPKPNFIVFAARARLR